jgi:alpha-1,3-rhamnosyltransferase
MNLINPKVTVRMPAYNHEAYVEQAILSIMNQTYQDFELIVIDDGSTDRTPKILERLSREHGFSYERQENLGVCRTLNKLIGLAKGEYMTGCASDDFWPPTRLEEQVAALDANPDSALVHGIVVSVDIDGEERPGTEFPFKRLADGCQAYMQLLRRKRDYFAGTIMVRKTVYELVGGYDENIKVEDLDWILRVTRRFAIKACNCEWMYYRQHGENWTATVSGIRRILESECKVILKQGVRYGAILLYSRLPVWFWFDIRAGSKRRFLYLILLPLYFLNKSYLYNFSLVLFGENLTQRLKRCKKWCV